MPRDASSGSIGFHPALASGFYGGLGSLAAQLAAALIAKPIKGPSNQTQQEKVGNMSDMYDILGGHIGYDASLIGDDPDALLEALAVSGMGDIFGGDGSSEIIGNVSPAQKSVLQQVVRRNAGAVVQRELDRRRRYPLGVVPTSITAGTQSQIPASPQNLFRPERLVIPSDIAFDSGVVDIKVGNVSQFVQSAEVPGALFSEVAINTGVNFDTAEIGNQISATIRNKSGATIEFSAGFVGTIAK
jgi:hypothetical protein